MVSTMAVAARTSVLQLVLNRDLEKPDFKASLVGAAGSNCRVGGRLGVVATDLLLGSELPPESYYWKLHRLQSDRNWSRGCR